MPTASLCCGGTSEERNGFHTYSYSTCSQVKQEKHRRYESVDISRAKNLEPVGYGRANVCVYMYLCVCVYTFMYNYRKQVASQVAQWERTCLQCRRHQRYGFNSWVGKIPWRRAWQHTPVFLPGESHGQRSLAGYSP